MEEVKKRIISALILHNNNRSKTAVELGLNRNSLYKLMSRITGVNWGEEYPITRPSPPRVPTEQRSATQKRVMNEKMESGYIPFSDLTEEQESRKRRNIKETFRKKREKRLNEFIPLAKKALSECDNSRSKAADMIGIKRSHFSKMMAQTKHVVNWSKDFPSNYLNNR